MAADPKYSDTTYFFHKDSLLTNRERRNKRGIVTSYVTDVNHILAIETMVGGEKNYDKLVAYYNKHLPTEIQIDNLDEVDKDFALYDKGMDYERKMYSLSEKRLRQLQKKLYQETKDLIEKVKPYPEMLLHLFITMDDDVTQERFMRAYKKHKSAMKQIIPSLSMNTLDRFLHYMDTHESNPYQDNTLFTLLKRGERFHKYSDPFDVKDLTKVATQSLLAESFLYSSKGKTMKRSFNKKHMDELTRYLHSLSSISDSSPSYSPVKTRRLRKKSRSKSKTRSKKQRRGSKSSSPTKPVMRRTRKRKHVVVDSSDSE
jgi:hypothetical protein